MTDRLKLTGFILLSLLLGFGSAIAATQVYQEPDAFVEQAFDNNPPEPELLWITGALREQASDILGHKPPSLRTRYWQQGERSAWVLEEVGKDLPITVGLIVNAGELEAVKVLIFRESRGWEVHNPAFVAQYTGADLTDNHQLDRRIDGITGATLSVRALNKLARLALLYAQHIASP